MDTNKISLKLSAVAISVILASCGGGGSDGYFGEGSGTGSSTNEPVAVSALKITNIELVDVTDKPTTTITVSGATAKVKVTDSTGKAISSALVTFTGEGLLFGTSNGAVLTNAEGEASITVKPENSTDTGSYSMSATVTHGTLSATTTPLNYTLQAANIKFDNMVAATTALESGASTIVTMKTVDGTTGSYQNNITADFSTSCGSFDNNSVVSSNQGDIAVTYKAIDAQGKLCEGEQTITAKGSDASASKMITVKIAAITANSLIYSTQNKVNLVTRNSGSASSGNIEFTVFANGTPAANQDVNIELAKGPGDLSFVLDGNRTPRTVRSDASGKVTVNLYPGNLPGPVEIKATLASNAKIFVLSKDVAVASGRVTQNGLSLSTSKNVLAHDYDGDTATITARMVDRVGNAVPDGTVISFISEGGSVTPNCATLNGQCQVTLTTQNPRPFDRRVSVLAFVEGDKSYTDVNGDNMYTAGVDKLLSNIGDFFMDDNENTKKDEGEFEYIRGATGNTCAASTFAQPNIPGSCDTKLDAVLRHQMLFGFASERPVFVPLTLSTVDPLFYKVLPGTFSFQMYGYGDKTVPMPSGTTISVSAKDNTENNVSCEADIIDGYTTVPAIMNLLTPAAFPQQSNGGVNYTVRSLKCAAGDEINVTVTSAKGTVTKRLLTIVNKL